MAFSEKTERILSALETSQQIHAAIHDWRSEARAEQIAPPGDWRTWLFLAGRGAGKTRSGAEWIREKVKHGYKRIALVAPTAADARDVMVEGSSGLLSVCWENDHTHDGVYMGRPVYQSSVRRVTWTNGAMATLYSAEEPNRLRGPQHDCFIAGTLVETESGAVPIECIREGDLVWTRAGLRRVVLKRNKLAPLCSVKFISGEELTGTFDHPIATEVGWRALSSLHKYDRVVACVTSASTGEARGGTATQAAITNIEALDLSGTKTEIDYIAQCGKALMGQFRAALISTTRTVIEGITRSRIFSYCLTEITNLCTSLATLCSVIGTRYQLSPSLAPLAGRYFAVKELQLTRSVNVAIKTRLIKNDPQSLPTVPIARKNLPHVKEDIVASDALILGDVGRVYNLMVEDPHEYIANGIVVHNCMWADEVASWYEPQEAWDMAMLGLRLGKDPQVMVSTTPRPIPLIRALLKDKTTVITRATTYDNKQHLAEAFMKQIIGKYEGTRLGRQELNAELLEESDSALWTRRMIERARLKFDLPAMRRTVVAIDPAVTAKEESNLTGVVVAGVGIDGLAYVLDDVSGKYTPNAWAQKAINAYRNYQADRIVAEGNQGGDLVRHTLENIDSSVPIKVVWASRGKQARAEPIAALYEQGKVRHAAPFAELEDQMCTWEPLGDEPSPDRLDAMVWALTALMVNQGGPSGVGTYGSVGTEL